MFRELLESQRCLVPASGFFEWKHEDGRKVPFYIHVKDNPVFGFAGLYDVWKNLAGTTLRTYPIVTTHSKQTDGPNPQPDPGYPQTGRRDALVIP